MKKIGLVDYFIDEWHSNNYIVWIKELCEKNGYEFEVKYAWAETDTYEGKLSTDAWCAQKGIEKCNTLEELCCKSDYIMVLAPANPEKHLKYAETVLKYGKNTYIDKTFAPCADEAKKIFALGEKYATKFFSTSALRYAEELDDCRNAIAMMLKGGGRSFDEYIIHQIEMLVKTMGIGAECVKVFSSGNQKMCVVKYADGRCCFLEYAPSNSFGVIAEDGTGNAINKGITSPFFVNLLEHILKFFLDGELPFEKMQTIEVIRIRDALLKAAQTSDTWIKLI